MKEILLTSSVLILALLALRRLFRGTLSRRAQYALWGLVLLRLLVPASLPAAGFSLLTAAEPVMDGMEALYAAPDSMTVGRRDGGYVWGAPDGPNLALGPATEDNTAAFTGHDAMGNPVEGYQTYRHQFLLADILPPVWYGGMAVMTGWLVLSNLLFWRKLRKRRVPYAAEGARYPVYLVEDGLPSPCLFGLFRPAVYLTPAAASPDALRHVLAHEETHARHLDPLWSLLRGVCLAVYWFDPLVWWAALASRTDCELACDEGALKRLGEAERIPYGRTLLSLIPVRRVPSDPFLSATTMTADKRRLMDRVSRIAEDRRSLGTALFAAVALAALVCAVTFTGAKADNALRPLTQEELDYFNGAFFTEPCGRGENRRRQFLTCLYDNPRNIELYPLLYNGTGLPEEITDEDRQFMEYALESAGPGEPSFVKLSVQNIEAFLLENTGLSAQDNLRDWEGNFWWNEDKSAYYNLYFKDGVDPLRDLEPVTFASGTREGGTVRLYYQGTLYSDSQMFSMSARTVSRGLLCLTLREKPEGGWWFVSNEWAGTASDAAPDWEPIYTISLDGLEPYAPEVPETVSVPPNAANWEMLGGPEDPDHILGDYALLFFRAGGRVYAGVQSKLRSSWPPPFLALPGRDYSVTWFRDLFGRDGFAIHCDTRVLVREDPPTYSVDGKSFTNYYYLDGEGQPVLLASVPGLAPQLVDLDGDGQRELVSQGGVSGAEFFFQRDGTLYRAELDALLRPFWPEDTLFSYENWDAATRSLSLRTWLNSFSSLAEASQREYRTLYFDGENLLVYNDQRHFEDHFIEWFDVDSTVKEAAQEAVEQEFRTAAGLPGGIPCDDWRITELMWSRLLPVDGQQYRVWQVACEFHSPEPRDMPGLGARDCWADPFAPDSLFLVFRDDSPDEYQSVLTYLFSMRQGDWPTADQLSERLQAADLPGSAAVRAQAALDRMLEEDAVTMTLLSAQGGGSYETDPQAGNGPNRA